MPHIHTENITKISDRMLIRKRHIIYGLFTCLLMFASSVSLLHLSPYKSSGGSGTYYRAKITDVTSATDPYMGKSQHVKAMLLDSPRKGKVVSVTRAIGIGDKAYNRLPVGSTALLYKNKTSQQYSFISRWYMPGIATLFLIMLALVIVIGGWRGITSVFGLTISILILSVFVIPRIVSGHGAFATCIEGAVLITLVSVYVAHGISKRTTIAFVSSLAVLGAVVGLTGFATYVTGSSEIIDESNIGVLYAAHPIDVAGLLTGGVVIASLGTVFDITTGQAATVDEIHKADRRQSTWHLFLKGMSVGREHIAALINTLALVYAGVALPSIVTTVLYTQNANYSHIPLLVNLNTETIAEEVVRTTVASISMMLALPITTWLAAYILPRWTPAASQKIKHWFNEG